MVCVELRVVGTSVGPAVRIGTSVTGVSAEFPIQASTKWRNGNVGNGVGSADHMMCTIHNRNQFLLIHTTQVFHDVSTQVT